MNKYVLLLNQALDKLGFLSQDNKISITNVACLIFIAITAFRAMFGGFELNLGSLKGSVQPIDLASTLPLLYSLLNYSHKRMTNNDNQQPPTEEKQ